MGINAQQFWNMVDDAIGSIGLHSESAAQLLVGTAAQESHLGTYLRQIRGPALGVFQMEPATHNDIWENYIAYQGRLKDDMRARYAMATAETMVYDLRYAAIMARIHYLRVPTALPEDIEGQAHYWKEHYNTFLGAGTVEEYLQNYRRLVE